MVFKLHRIKTTGGSPFKLYPVGNPPLEHDGGTSIHSLYVNEEELEAITHKIEQSGSTVEVLDPVEQDQDQKEERLALLGIGKQDSVWPSLDCTKCSWFDPVQKTPCGVASWNPEVVSTFLEQKKPKSDFESCPVPDWRDSQ
jgi:hypothetical protein